jgi:hypothetical protein
MTLTTFDHQLHRIAERLVNVAANRNDTLKQLPINDDELSFTLPSRYKPKATPAGPNSDTGTTRTIPPPSSILVSNEADATQSTTSNSQNAIVYGTDSLPQLVANVSVGEGDVEPTHMVEAYLVDDNDE